VTENVEVEVPPASSDARGVASTPIPTPVGGGATVGELPESGGTLVVVVEPCGSVVVVVFELNASFTVVVAAGLTTTL
jgi:hypothetical protein